MFPLNGRDQGHSFFQRQCRVGVNVPTSTSTPQNVPLKKVNRIGVSPKSQQSRFEPLSEGMCRLLTHLYRHSRPLPGSGEISSASHTVSRPSTSARIDEKTITDSPSPDMPDKVRCYRYCATGGGLHYLRTEGQCGGT